MEEIKNFSFPYGDTKANDEFVGKLASLTVDLETPSLRVHDGETPGGLIELTDFRSIFENGKEGDLVQIGESGKLYFVPVDEIVDFEVDIVAEFHRLHEDRSFVIPRNLVGDDIRVYIEGVRLKDGDFGMRNNRYVFYREFPKGTEVMLVGNQILSSDLVRGIALKGPRNVYANTTVQYEITDFDSFSEYDAWVDYGHVDYENGTIYLRVPDVLTQDTINLSVRRGPNTVKFVINCYARRILPAEWVHPQMNAQDLKTTTHLEVTEFKTKPEGTDQLVGSEWEVFADPGLKERILHVDFDRNQPHMYRFLHNDLPRNVNVYARHRYIGDEIGVGEWSDILVFKIDPDIIELDTPMGQIFPFDPNFSTWYGHTLECAKEGKFALIGSPYAEREHGRLELIESNQSNMTSRSAITAYEAWNYGLSASGNYSGTEWIISGNGLIHHEDVPFIDTITVSDAGEVTHRHRLEVGTTEDTVGRCIALSPNGRRMAVDVHNYAEDMDEVWLYERNVLADEWTFVQTLSGAPGDLFGSSLIWANDDQLLIAVMGDDVQATDRGSIHRFNWGDTHTGRIISNLQTEAKYTGISMDVSKDGYTLVVSTSQKDQPGYVLVFHKNETGVYVQESRLDAERSGTGFGKHVRISLDGDRIYVSEPDYGYGVVHLYMQFDRGWEVVKKFAPDQDYDETNKFGNRIGLLNNDSYLLIAAPATDYFKLSSGSIYYFM